MGWSHAVNICQHVVQSICRLSGMPTSAMVQERQPIPDLSKGAVVTYVDNIVIASTDKQTGMDMMAKVVAAFIRAGLTVHEIFYGVENLTTLGWEFQASDQSFRPKKARLWRLHGAIDFALSRGALNGRGLARIVGNFVSMSLLRRECLCVLSASYSFIWRHESASHPLWPSVRRELRWMRSLLPMLVHFANRPVLERVLAVDASP